MYRSPNESHLARIVSLEQQLAEAREALKAANVEPPLSPEEQDQRIETAGLHLLLVSAAIFAFLVIAVAIRCAEPAEPATVRPATMELGDPLRVGYGDP